MTDKEITVAALRYAAFAAYLGTLLWVILHPAGRQADLTHFAQKSLLLSVRDASVAKRRLKDFRQHDDEPQDGEEPRVAFPEIDILLSQLGLGHGRDVERDHFR